MKESTSGVQSKIANAKCTQPRKSSRKGVPKNALCQVSDEPVLKRSHFGNALCFSCKAFFKRVTRVIF